ncbi:hypothetical protein NQ176_g8020 [Zarea fungicola]|uniref:Uncharacterized protein n=1 Tax=Zarea fungicola TaxID=93591 RepID=A0ACC1MVB2_9HYPO|nr:hypothetical protein NQ176_g8020 [Lecanicillium fungicola]
MVLLDITIAVLSWQQLVWGKFVKERIQVIANVLALSAFTVFIYNTLRSIWGSAGNTSESSPLLCGSDVFWNSIALSVLVISASLWICHTNLTGPVGIATIFAGMFQTYSTALSYGNWDYLSRVSVLLPLFVTTTATIAFTYAQRLKNVAVFHRGFFNWVVALIALFSTLRALLVVIPVYDERHPINQLIYDSEIDYRHWSVKISTSRTSSTAARIYEDRHSGRQAPPLFKEWFAQLHRAKIRDSFPQIDEDLEPFWQLTPEQLRAAVEEAAQLPGVATLVIKDGQASIGSSDADGLRDRDGSLAKLVQMASNFSAHLPDMILPINLARSPRILPLWKKRWPINRASDHGAVADVISGRSPRQAEISAAHEALGGQNAMTVSEFRTMLRQACPPNSASRANPYLSTAGFCRACAGAHSTLQLMSDWQTSLDSVCSQPDLAYLHGFYMTAPDVRPVQKLLPLFSLYKTAHFADILLPLSPGDAAENEEVEGPGAAAAPDKPFLDRSDNISWSGSIGQNTITPEYLHGHHKLRLLGQLVRPRPTDKTTLIKPIIGDTRQWVYAKRTTADVNSKLPLNVGLSDYTACTGHNCDTVRLLFAGDDDRYRQAVGDGVTPRPPPPRVDDSKLTLLLDEDDGPAPGTMHALRTETVPILSTIFKTWYTSRLKPWVHFIPVDVRYQALHTTLSYFTVLEDRRDSGVMDSKGVAQQGKSWAKEVLREEDREIYLFRLLIEWARLIDERRDEISFNTPTPQRQQQPKKKVY